MLSRQNLSVFVGLHSHTSSYDCCANKFDVESESNTANSNHLDNQVLIAFQFPWGRFIATNSSIDFLSRALVGTRDSDLRGKITDSHTTGPI